MGNYVNREYVHSVAIYMYLSKISNEARRINNFQGLARKLSLLPTKLDIFDIRQNYICILFIFQRLIC